jgi:hypothetical protein
VGAGWAECVISREATALPHSKSSLQFSSSVLANRRLLSLCLPAFLLSCAPGESKSGLGPADPSPVVLLGVSPESAAVSTDGTLAFSARAVHEDGSTSVPAVSWTAGGGSITSNGVYTAGSAAGVYAVTATFAGESLTGSATVTVSAAVSPIVSLSVSPYPASVLTGGTQAFAATATRQDGSTLVPTVTWTATGGTITPDGIYSAGATAGSFAVTATLAGGGLAATAPVTVSVAVSPIVILSISPSSATVNAGATRTFTASATRQDGTTLIPLVTWTATGGAINGSGVYAAGSAGGSYRVIAALNGGTLADTSTVTVVSPTVTLTVAPPTATVNSGATQAFTASALRQDGTSYAPTVTWTATGGSITSGGVFTAGTVPGSYRAIAQLQGGTLRDTSIITVPAPVLQAVILTPSSASLNPGGTQQFSVSGQWSSGGTGAPPVTYAATGGTITSGGLYTAGASAGAFRVIAVQQGGTLADTALVSVSGGGGGTILFSEGFEDGNLGGRGWFGATSVATTADARPGSAGARALEWHWTTGMTAPHSASRMDFVPSTTIYLSYWVKQSSNWIGSGQSYHPHMFQLLTTADDHWIGPSRTHLTLDAELIYDANQGGSRVNLALQDALNIDTTRLYVDLTNVTEQRAIGGYNGHPEPGFIWNEYDAGGGTYMNGKELRPSVIVMTDATKSSWHHVETYWQMNTISGGKGQPDGIVQTWFDGVLVADRRDVYFRTNANPTMQFRTFLLGPYIGNGSPVDQYMWIDDVVIATAKP